MTTLVLECSREDAKALVKSAFEMTPGIKQYHDDGPRIVGKTGMSIGSYGESIIVDVPEAQSNETETMISVTADKEVSVNITANPEKYKSRFLSKLQKLRQHDVEDALDVVGKHVTADNSKEVGSANELREGTSSVSTVMIVMLILSLLFTFMMMAAMMP